MRATQFAPGLCHVTVCFGGALVRFLGSGRAQALRFVPVDGITGRLAPFRYTLISKRDRALAFEAVFGF